MLRYAWKTYCFNILPYNRLGIRIILAGAEILMIGQVNNAKHESKQHVFSLSTEEDEILKSITQQKAEEIFIRIFVVRAYVAFPIS